MAFHDSATVRIDAPTIAFERQVTTHFPSGTFAQELFDATTMSTMRPVVRPATLTERTRSKPAREGSRWLLYVLCMAIGVAAGHVVRERQAYASRTMSVIEGLRTSPKAAARVPREANVMGVRETNMSIPRPKVDSQIAGAIATRKPSGTRSATARTKPAPAVSAKSASSAVDPADGLFVDFELSFRAPQ